MKTKIECIKHYSNTHARNRNQPHKRSKYTSSILMLASGVMMITSFNWLAMQHQIHTHLFSNQTHIFVGLIFSHLYCRHSHSTNWTVQNSNRKFRCFTVMLFLSPQPKGMRVQVKLMLHRFVSFEWYSSQLPPTEILFSISLYATNCYYFSFYNENNNNNCIGFGWTIDNWQSKTWKSSFGFL